MPNGLSHSYQLYESISNLVLLGSMQTVQSLIRRRVLRRLIWFYTVCRCAIEWALCLNRLRINSMHVCQVVHKRLRYGYTQIVRLIPQFLGLA